MITSTRNARVVAAARLKKRGLREQHRRFLVEGAQATGEALDVGALEELFHVPGAGGRVEEVVARAKAASVPVVAVSDQVMAHLTSAVTPQGLVGAARFVDTSIDDVSPAGMVPLLCSVRDPGNAGAILRSADAAGAEGVVFTKDSVDLYNPKTVRASAGSLFHLPVVRDVEPAEAVSTLRAGGAQILAADARGDRSMYEADLTRPTAVLVGNEAWGLPSEVRDLADATVRVPIHGRAESLNLAAAAALLLFEGARQRSVGATLAAVVAASSHDLRLPLTALKGFAATLVDRWDRFDEPTRRELLQGMLLDLDRVSGMVTIVLELARIERGAVRRSAEPVEVEGILADLARRFGQSPDYPDVTARGTARVVAEPDRVYALLLVLCEAVLWWGEGGPIDVDARQEGPTAVVEVSRAAGSADLSAAFDLAGDKPLLLAARMLTEALGGRLTADVDGTVRFRLELPS